MCIICIDWQKGLLTTKDAARNFREIASTLDIDHAIKLEEELQIVLELEDQMDKIHGYGEYSNK